ncbi:MAG: hypothetical protein QF645_09155 [Planctomycetota bacterium]|nr:hypothetical protein [Planctomycetota bacterium]
MIVTFLFLCSLPLQDSSLEKAFQDLRAKDRSLREAAQMTILAAGPKAIPLAIQAWQGDATELKARAESLVKELSSPSWNVRNDAMNRMIEIGWVLLPFLQDLIPVEDPEVTWRIRVVEASLQESLEKGKKREKSRKVFLLYVFGRAHSQEVLPILLGTLEDDSFRLRLSAAHALSRLRNLLESKQVRQTVESVMDDLRVQKDFLIRSQLIQILGEFRMSVSIKPLADLLQSGGETHVHLLRSTLFALAKIGGSLSFQAIVRGLEDERVYVRHAAGEILQKKAGGELTFDARNPEKAVISHYQKWWEKEFGESWTDP